METLKMPTDRRDFLKSWILPFSVAATMACNPSEASQQVAQDFIKAYYVAIDLDKAQKFSAALALEKVQKQSQLMEGLKPEGASQKPSVTFKLMQTQGSAASKTYQYRIHSGKAPTEQILDVLVKVRQMEGSWKVVTFLETASQL